MTPVSRLTPLYKVELIANGKQHFYKIADDETYYPGVTTVLSILNKPAILPWAIKMMGENVRVIDSIVNEGKQIYKKKASDAADIGSRVHKAIDDIIHGVAPEITEDIKAGVEGFLAWKESHKLTIELGDTRLGSKLFGYGGSLDFVAFDGDEATIWDLKTTKKRKDKDHGAYDEMALQISSYCNAFTETYGIRVKAAYILWVNKEKAEFKAVKVNNIQTCFEGFLAALKLYQLSKYELFEV